MLANYLIGLREGLEASLVVSILVAYLVRVGRRDQLSVVGAGVGAAVALSVAFGAALTYTSTSLLQTGSSQEAFGGTCSLIAVALVTVMIFWMRRTARHLKTDLDHRLDAALEVGGLAVALTAFVAVGREGLETALFFWSAVQAAGSTATPILGFALGIATAVVLAWLLYRRSVKLNLARFFTWTGAALIVVAAGVLGYARARPAGGQRPRRPAQPRLRRHRPDPAEQLVRGPAQGRLQLQPRHDVAPGGRLRRLPRPGPARVLPDRPAASRPPRCDRCAGARRRRPARAAPLSARAAR